MAPLYGRLKGEPYRKEVTRRGFYGVESRLLGTWDGAIKTELDRDGTYRVFVGEKCSPDSLIATGNVSAGVAQWARELEIIEVISAADAMVNARVELEDAEADGRIGADRWEEIRRYVFPLIEAEAARLDAEYQRLRGEGA